MIPRLDWMSAAKAMLSLHNWVSCALVIDVVGPLIFV
jgi:hypothetical protein